MAKGQREPVKGYLVVGEDGRLSAVAAGDPPAGSAGQGEPGCGWPLGYPWLYLRPQPLMAKRVSRAGLDQTLLGWIDALYKPAVKSSPEDMYWFTLDGALDHLQHGITGVYNFNFEARTRGANPPTADEYDKSGFRAEMDSGIRFVHSMSWARLRRWVSSPVWGGAGACAFEGFSGLDESTAQVEQLSFSDDQRRHSVQQYLSTNIDGKAAGGRVPSGQ